VLRLGRAEAQARVRALRKLELVAVGSISSCNSIPSLVYIEVALVMSMPATRPAAPPETEVLIT
jgi:hypothetical protein